MILIEEDKAIARKSLLLLGEILRLSNKILPSQYAAKLQALPRLFNGAAEFTNPTERSFALSALSSIDSLNRNQAQLSSIGSARISHSGNGGGDDPVERGRRAIQGVKLKAGLAIEDRQFQQMIVDSGVCPIFPLRNRLKVA